MPVMPRRAESRKWASEQGGLAAAEGGAAAGWQVVGRTWRGVTEGSRRLLGVPVGVNNQE
uniref:Uncharacterized protein n=1 Tax=Oryza sativa subsp. japonica TaxID=39947 RepID=Q8H4P6_ORYSJ|nr:hypothetical protein [Oryza sativa Japonica Group]